MKTTAFLSALLLAAVCCTAAAAPVTAEPAVTEPPVTEPVMTTPVKQELTDPAPELYGFAAETPVLTLNAGETYPLKAVWDADCYLAESLQFASDNSRAASVTRDGVITAQTEGTAVIRITAKLNPETVSLPPQDTLVRTVTATVTVIDNTRTAEQKDALKQLEQKENRLFGEFRRERAVIKGILTADAPRLTMDAVSGIIGNAGSYAEIMQKLSAAQPYPDYIGGSGLTLIEYWFDQAGTEKILAVEEQSELVYICLNPEDGSTQEWRFIYPAEQQDTQSFRDKLANLTYMVFNSIASYGDANTDGMVDVADAVLIARYAVSDPEAILTDQGRINADVTHDGNADGQDAAKILLYIAKRISFEDLAN